MPYGRSLSVSLFLCLSPVVLAGCITASTEDGTLDAEKRVERFEARVELLGFPTKCRIARNVLQDSCGNTTSLAVCHATGTFREPCAPGTVRETCVTARYEHSVSSWVCTEKFTSCRCQSFTDSDGNQAVSRTEWKCDLQKRETLKPQVQCPMRECTSKDDFIECCDAKHGTHVSGGSCVCDGQGPFNPYFESCTRTAASDA